MTPWTDRRMGANGPGALAPRPLLALWLIALVAGSVAASTGEDDAARIRRVEHGLRPYAHALFGDEERCSIGERMEHYGVPGVSLAVIRGGRLAWARGYGVKDVETGEPVDTGTLFQAASISKSVNAVAVMKLVERGTVDLDRDVNSYLESWQLPANELTASTRITVARLLNHTAGTSNFNDRTGYIGYRSTDPLPTALQILEGEPPAKTRSVVVEAPPGAFHYSNSGTVILQLLLMEAEDRPYEELMQRLVLEPAGMENSTFRMPLPAALQGRAASAHDGPRRLEGKYELYPELAAAGLWTTPSDLVRFIGGHWRALHGEPEGLLSQESAARMLTGAVDEHGAALGFFVTPKGDQLYYGHRGGNYGFYSDMVINKQTGDGAVVMVNGGSDSVNSNLRREILIAIAAEYGWKGYLPPRVETVPLSAERAARLAGRYRLDADRVVELRAEDGGLVARGTDAPVRGVVSLYPEAGGGLVARTIRPLRMELLEGAEPAADTLVISGEAGVEEAVRAGAQERTPYELLAAGDAEAGVAAYEKLRRRDPAGALVSERRINRLGYALLRQGSVQEAIALFRLNTRWYPEAANTHDSLGEAYLAAGERRQAVECYRRALELDPDSANARDVLRRLGALQEEK